MSLYNIINGVRPAAFFALPILGWHGDDIPRFRDVFLGDEEHPDYDGFIHVYTRVGGGNRDCGFGEEMLYAHPLYEATWDDSFDSTFATYCFRVPDEFKADIEKMRAGDYANLSPELQAKCRATYPKLATKFDELWGAPVPS